MTSPIDTTRRRRTVLKLLGAAAGATTIGSVVHGAPSESDSGRSIVLEQGDSCIELVPLSGDEPVEEFYDYRYPTELFDSVSGSNGSSYSSEGTTDLQKGSTSILFLYDGPEGLSLVVVHGRLEGEEDNGGAVTFTLDGMPEDAEWVVRDDYYTVDGVPADTNHDNWDVDGSTHQIDWGYRSDRTDGGAARNLGDEFEITIDPAFNDDAALATDIAYGPIEAWEAISGDRDSPDRVSLDMDEPVTVRTGTCEAPSGGDDNQDGQDDQDNQDGQDGQDGEDGQEDQDSQDGQDDQDGQDNQDGQEDQEDQDGEPDDQDGEKDKEGDSDEGC